jgi:CRP-like cAMP-binding protein
MSLLQNGKYHNLPKKQVLNLSDGNMTLSLVQSGYIKRYLITNDGSQSVQAIYGPGDVFPLTPLFRLFYDKNIYRGEETYYYETMTPVRVHSLSTQVILDQLQKDPLLYKDILYVAGMRLGSNILRLENFSLRTAPRRIAHRLLYYADKFGEKQPDGVLLKMPLTHQNLADILSLARETVTHCLTHFQEKGVIKVVDKCIFVPDIERLRKELS